MTDAIPPFSQREDRSPDHQQAREACGHALAQFGFRGADSSCNTLSPIGQPASDMEDGMISSNALSGIDDQTVADTALVVEALAAFAGPPADLETHDDRRAWELISSLAEDLSMTPSELLRIDAHRQSQTS